MESQVKPSDHQMHAWVDGRLGPAELTGVESYLDAHPAERARWASLREQSRELRNLLESRLEDTAISSQTSVGGSRWRPSLAWRMAAGIALSVLSGAAGWGLNDLSSTEPIQATARQELFARSALVAHAVFSTDERRRVEIDAAQEDQLVAWLSNRMAQPLSPPNLRELGYVLEGGRLLPGARGPMAQFMYRRTGFDAEAHRLTVAISNRMALDVESIYQRGADTVSATFRFAELDGVQAFYWVDGNMGYAISAIGDRAHLATVAQEIHRQLHKADGMSR